MGPAKAGLTPYLNRSLTRSVETPVKLTEHQRKLLKELDESLKKGGEKHSPNAKSWTDRVKDLFK